MNLQDHLNNYRKVKELLSESEKELNDFARRKFVEKIKDKKSDLNVWYIGFEPDPVIVNVIKVRYGYADDFEGQFSVTVPSR